MKLQRYLLLVFALGTLTMCTKPDQIIDDFKVHITPTFFKYVVEVNLSDITNPDDEFDAPTEVTITGEDAEAIYNIDGTKNFAVNFGTIQLMVAREFEPTEEDPLRFRVNVEADGFKGASVPVAIENESYFVETSADMLNLNDLPDGVDISDPQKQAVNPTTNTLSTPMVIRTGTKDSASTIKLTIPDDVKFLDENGNVIKAKNGSGDLEVEVTSYSDTSQAAQRAMPNGGGMIQPVKVDGQEEEDVGVLLSPNATFDIDMQLNGQKVTGFSGGKKSGGVKAKIAVPDHMINPETEQPYSQGDSIGMMSLSDNKNEWEVQKGKSYVVKRNANNGKLYAEPEIEHLSHWRLWYRYAFWRAKRRKPIFYTFTGHLKDAKQGSSINGAILFQVRRVTKRRRIYVKLRGSFGAERSRRNPRRRFRVFWPITAPIVRAHSFGPNFNFTVQPKKRGRFLVSDAEIENTQKPVRIGYQLFCEGSNAIMTPPAGTKMFYRESNGSSDKWRHLYTFTQANLGVKKAEMHKLQDGLKYDFKAFVGEHQKDTSDVLIEDGAIYRITLPKAACDAVGL